MVSIRQFRFALLIKKGSFNNNNLANSGTIYHTNSGDIQKNIYRYSFFILDIYPKVKSNRST